jgi:PAS domain S-box-containing protein
MTKERAVIIDDYNVCKLLNLTGKNKELFDTSLEPTIVTRVGYGAICIDVNEKYLELIGYLKEELINKSTHQLVNKKVPVFEKLNTLNGRITSWDELELISKKGDMIKVLASSLPLFDEQGELLGYMHLVKDLTLLYQSKKSEDSLCSAINCAQCNVAYPKEYGECPACKFKN